MGHRRRPRDRGGRGARPDRHPDLRRSERAAVFGRHVERPVLCRRSWADDRAGPNQNSIFAAQIDGDGIVLDPDGISLAIAAHPMAAGSRLRRRQELGRLGELRHDPGYRRVRRADRARRRPRPRPASRSPRPTPPRKTWRLPGTEPSTSQPGRTRATPADYVDIFGSRLTSDGTVLDDGITVSLAANEQVNSSIAFDGANYLVVWEDYRRRELQAGHLRGAGLRDRRDARQHGRPPDDHRRVGRLSGRRLERQDLLVVWDHWVTSSASAGLRREGHPWRRGIDPDGFPISQGPSQFAPAVAASSDDFLVVWERNEQAVYGARVSPAGVVLKYDGFVIDPASDREAWPDVAWDGTNSSPCGAAMTSRTARTSGEQSLLGAVLDSAGIAIATGFARRAVHAWPGAAGCFSVRIWNHAARTWRARVYSGGHRPRP